jgi:hypothetical protein
VHKHTVCSKFTPIKVTADDDLIGEMDGRMMMIDKYNTLLTPEEEHLEHCTN